MTRENDSIEPTMGDLQEFDTQPTALYERAILDSIPDNGEDEESAEAPEREEDDTESEESQAIYEAIRHSIPSLDQLGLLILRRAARLSNEMIQSAIRDVASISALTGLENRTSSGIDLTAEYVLGAMIGFQHQSRTTPDVDAKTYEEQEEDEVAIEMFRRGFKNGETLSRVLDGRRNKRS